MRYWHFLLLLLIFLLYIIYISTRDVLKVIPLIFMVTTTNTRTTLLDRASFQLQRIFPFINTIGYAFSLAMNMKLHAKLVKSIPVETAHFFLWWWWWCCHENVHLSLTQLSWTDQGAFYFIGWQLSWTWLVTHITVIIAFSKLLEYCISDVLYGHIHL